MTNLDRTSAAYSLEEVSTHNTPEDCWVTVNGLVYDLTSWQRYHPGGMYILGLVAGRDVTDLIHSYHPFTNKPLLVLPSLQIGVLTDYKPVFVPDSGFYHTARTRVHHYFKANHKDPKSLFPSLIYLKFFLLLGFLSFYLSLMIETSLLAGIFAVSFGVLQALPLLHTMHDASHFALSHSPSLWRFLGKLTMDVYAGASLDSWMHQHVLGHHVYTNILGSDPDLPSTTEADIRRVSLLQKWAWYYSFQHYYIIVLYGALALKFRVQDITCTLFQRRNGTVLMNPQTVIFSVYLISIKVLFVLWRVVLPVLLLDTSLHKTLTVFLISELVTGYYLAFNFQVSHISPSVAFADVAKLKLNNESADCSDNNECEERETREWAVHQVLSSVDYAHDHWWATFLSGALNYQVVHHLFPGVSQYHYPAIAPIVQQVCKEHKVAYTVLSSFTSAFKEHVTHLKAMGAPSDDCVKKVQ